MNGATARVADNRHVERELDVPGSAEVTGELGDLDARLIRHRDEGNRVRHLGSECSTLRSAHCHHHRCMQVGAVELP
jgi:hypothetical protein